MQKAIIFSYRFMVFLFICGFITPVSISGAEERLRYSCSVQINEAFNGALDSFSKNTGIKVNMYVTSSSAAVYRLMNGFSDLASSTRPLSFEQKDMGYMQFAFCKDPLSIIVNSKNEVCDIFENQLRDIFTGKITNWKSLGGSDQPIVVIIPEKASGVYQAFDYAVMKGKAVKYDIMTKRSTMVVAVVKNIPGGISFVSQGASMHHEGIQAIKIDSLEPKNKCYPYYQTFLFVSKGKPEGPAKAFIDFAYTDEGKKIIENRNMIPISNKIYLETLKTCSEVGLGY